MLVPHMDANSSPICSTSNPSSCQPIWEISRRCPTCSECSHSCVRSRMKLLVSIWPSPMCNHLGSESVNARFSLSPPSFFITKFRINIKYFKKDPDLTAFLVSTALSTYCCEPLIYDSLLSSWVHTRMSQVDFFSLNIQPSWWNTENVIQSTHLLMELFVLKKVEMILLHSSINKEHT